MAGPRVTRARQLAVQLTGVGVKATHDASKVQANAPCVLVGPPRLAFDHYDGATATWRLLVIAGHADQLKAWDQIDALVELLTDEVPAETAEPTSWALAPGNDPMPAYAVTFTETL